jgi:predicted phage terminase large subunit-like protein
MAANTGLITAARARLILLRRQAWDSFYVFAKFVCGNDLMEEQPHREVCQFLTAGVDTSSVLGLNCVPEITVQTVIDSQRALKKLLMLPRGSFKSTIASIAYPIWLLWHNPSLRIMLDCETLANAKFYLSAIKDMIENNEMLKLICVDDDGGYILEPHKSIAGGFTEDQVILKTRTKVGLKEPTLFCSGVDNARTGMHPDVIIMDDMVSERNVTTPAQIEKVKDHYRFSLSLLEPEGLQVVIGTRYHMADLYNDLITSGALDTMIRPAVEKDGTLFFPTRLTRAFLDGQRKEQGSYIFSSQYLLTPISDEDAVFKKAWIQYYTKLPTIVEKYMMIDLAISQKQTADYTVVMCVGLDKDKKIYVLEYDREHYTPNQTIDSIFTMYLKHRDLVKGVGIETVAFQKAMIYFIKDEMRRRGIYMPLKELKADTDKIRRIGALQPLFENGDVFIKMEHVELENELLEFPFSRHDDVLDSVAYLPQLMRPGTTNTKPLTYAYDSVNKYVNY